MKCFSRLFSASSFLKVLFISSLFCFCLLASSSTQGTTPPVEGEHFIDVAKIKESLKDPLKPVAHANIVEDLWYLHDHHHPPLPSLFISPGIYFFDLCGPSIIRLDWTELFPLTLQHNDSVRDLVNLLISTTEARQSPLFMATLVLQIEWRMVMLKALHPVKPLAVENIFSHNSPIDTVNASIVDDIKSVPTTIDSPSTILPNDLQHPGKIIMQLLSLKLYVLSCALDRGMSIVTSSFDPACPMILNIIDEFRDYIVEDQFSKCHAESPMLEMPEFLSLLNHMSATSEPSDTFVDDIALNLACLLYACKDLGLGSSEDVRPIAFDHLMVTQMRSSMPASRAVLFAYLARLYSARWFMNTIGGLVHELFICTFDHITLYRSLIYSLLHPVEASGQEVPGKSRDILIRFSKRILARLPTRQAKLNFLDAILQESQIPVEFDLPLKQISSMTLDRASVCSYVQQILGNCYQTDANFKEFQNLHTIIFECTGRRMLSYQLNNQIQSIFGFYFGSIFENFAPIDLEDDDFDVGMLFTLDPIQGQYTWTLNKEQEELTTLKSSARPGSIASLLIESRLSEQYGPLKILEFGTKYLQISRECQLEIMYRLLNNCPILQDKQYLDSRWKDRSKREVMAKILFGDKSLDYKALIKSNKVEHVYRHFALWLQHAILIDRVKFSPFHKLVRPPNNGLCPEIDLTTLLTIPLNAQLGTVLSCLHLPVAIFPSNQLKIASMFNILIESYPEKDSVGFQIVTYLLHLFYGYLRVIGVPAMELLIYDRHIDLKYSVIDATNELGTSLELENENTTIDTNYLKILINNGSLYSQPMDDPISEWIKISKALVLYDSAGGLLDPFDMGLNNFPRSFKRWQQKGNVTRTKDISPFPYVRNYHLLKSLRDESPSMFSSKSLREELPLNITSIQCSMTLLHHILKNLIVGGNFCRNLEIHSLKHYLFDGYESKTKTEKGITFHRIVRSTLLRQLSQFVDVSTLNHHLNQMIFMNMIDKSNNSLPSTSQIAIDVLKYILDSWRSEVKEHENISNELSSLPTGPNEDDDDVVVPLQEEKTDKEGKTTTSLTSSIECKQPKPNTKKKDVISQQITIPNRQVLKVQKKTPKKRVRRSAQPSNSSPSSLSPLTFSSSKVITPTSQTKESSIETSTPTPIIQSNSNSTNDIIRDDKRCIKAVEFSSLGVAVEWRRPKPFNMKYCINCLKQGVGLDFPLGRSLIWPLIQGEEENVHEITLTTDNIDWSQAWKPIKRIIAPNNLSEIINKLSIEEQHKLASLIVYSSYSSDSSKISPENNDMPVFIKLKEEGQVLDIRNGFIYCPFKSQKISVDDLKGLIINADPFGRYKVILNDRDETLRLEKERTIEKERNRNVKLTNSFFFKFQFPTNIDKVDRITSFQDLKCDYTTPFQVKPLIIPNHQGCKPYPTLRDAEKVHSLLEYLNECIVPIKSTSVGHFKDLESDLQIGGGVGVGVEVEAWIALDFEFSGIWVRKRYIGLIERTIKSVYQHSIWETGFSFCKGTTTPLDITKDLASNVATYTLTTCPISKGPIMFDSYEFLKDNSGFDFDIYNQEALLEFKYLRPLLQSLSDQKRLLVVHNGLYDLLHIVKLLLGKSKFIQEVNSNNHLTFINQFFNFMDTCAIFTLHPHRWISAANERRLRNNQGRGGRSITTLLTEEDFYRNGQPGIWNSRLDILAQLLLNIPTENVKLHNAGVDSFLTGQLYQFFLDVDPDLVNSCKNRLPLPF